MGVLIQRFEFSDCVKSSDSSKLLQYFNNYKSILPDNYIMEILEVGRVDLMIEVINHKRYSVGIRDLILCENSILSLGSNFDIVKQMLAVDKI